MLNGTRILVWGARHAVELGGCLLRQAEAQVDVLDARSMPDSAQFGPIQAYDAVLVSSDVATIGQKALIAEARSSGQTIVCDITATGLQSARGGVRWSESQIQAITGLMETTGFATAPPVHIGVPFTEISAALYAALAVAAAIRVQRTRGFSQNIDVTLFGCAASALTTFLPKVFDRGVAARVGNRHPSCAPWNAYRTKDGWILICTSTEEQWQKIKGATALPELADERFTSLGDRVRHVADLDALIEGWTATLTTEECSAICERIGVAAGPIVAVSAFSTEPNFRVRHPKVAEALQTVGVGRSTFEGISPFRVVPLVSDQRHDSADEAFRPKDGAAEPGDMPGDDSVSGNAGPLAGVNVIEIGQYTTAPLVGKHLAALGATVTKIEPPEGETSRAWMPGQGGMSYFFALNNTDKRTIALDLKDHVQRDYLCTLIRSADVLIENLRPGALAKLGFDRESLAALNPRLIYCSISGFGLESAYPTRPAFDTVIQAMGGWMDLTRSADVPVKVGISGADILGGQSALFAIVAALAARGQRRGRFVEISMQDVVAWSSLFAAGNPEPRGEALACQDGYVWLQSDSDHDVESLAAHARRVGCESRTRAEIVRELEIIGMRAVPVLRVDELIEDGDFLSDVLSVGRDESGAFWPIVKVPYRLGRTPAKVRTVPGAPVPIECPGRVAIHEA